MAETPDPWADLADDIRRAVPDAGRAEAWQARAELAEARVAELEAIIVVAAAYLRDDRPTKALQLLDSVHA